MLWTLISNYLEILIHGNRSLTYLLPYKIYCRESEVRSHIPGEFSHVIDLIKLLLKLLFFEKRSPHLAVLGPNLTPAVCLQLLKQMM